MVNLLNSGFTINLKKGVNYSHKSIIIFPFITSVIIGFFLTLSGLKNVNIDNVYIYRYCESTIPLQCLSFKLRPFHPDCVLEWHWNNRYQQV